MTTDEARGRRSTTGHVRARKPECSSALLTAEDELDLAMRIKAGDKTARERLIIANLRLVAKFARLYRDSGVPLDDLMQGGTEGLINAVDRFDPQTYSTKLSTYAMPWILKGIRLAAGAGRLLSYDSVCLDGLSCSPDCERDLANAQHELQLAIDSLSAIESLLIRYRFGLICKARKQRRKNNRRSATTPSGTKTTSLTQGRIRSYTAVSRELGLPLYRVRMIEQAALAKLRGRLDPELLASFE